MTRAHGYYGALPRDHSVGAVIFEKYLTNVHALPSAPLTADRLTKVTSWPMYLNDKLSDCTDAGMLHSVAALTAFSGRVPGGAVFDDSVASAMYSATGGYVPGDPSTDNGATLQSVAQYMVDTGVTDTAGNHHQLAAWAQIGDPTNLRLLKKILNVFGTVYCAFDMPQAAETQFDQGKPWIPVSRSADAGGHCMPLQFSAVDDPGYMYNETLITWGAAQKASMGWMHSQLREAIVLVSPDWLDSGGSTVEGLDMNALLADMRLV